jgi:hypothetical protein
MLVPLSQKAEASETVFLVVLSLAGCAFAKGVGLSSGRLYQTYLRLWQRVLLVFGVLNPVTKRTYLSQPTRGLGFL